MSNRPHRKTSTRVQRAQAAEKAAARRRQLLWAGGAAAVVLVALAIALVLNSGDGDNNSDTTAGGPEQAFNGPKLAPFAAGGADQAIGQKAPLFVTDNLQGERVNTGGGGGPNDTAKIVVFAAHWCPVCREEIPEVAAWLADNELPPGVEVVTVSTFPDPTRDNHPPDAWFAAMGWPTQVLVDTGDGAIAAGFGMSSVPSWVVLDNYNFVLGRAAGAIGTDGFADLVALAATGVGTAEGGNTG